MDGKELGLSESQKLLSSSDSEKSTTPPRGNASLDTSEVGISKSEVVMSAPEDRFQVAYIIFYFLGLGTLLPWNFFITANEYWMYKLQDDNSTSTNPTVEPSIITQSLNSTPIYSETTSSPGLQYNKLQSLFQNSLAVCAMLPNVIFQFLNTVLQQRIPEKFRMLGTLTTMVLFFVLTEVLVKMDTSSWREVFFAVTLMSVVILNCCAAVFQSSLFGMAGRMPPRYIQALMAGQGMGGVFASLAMISALAYSSDPTDSAFAYFLTAIVVLVLNGVFYVLLQKNEYYKHFHNGPTEKEKHKNAINADVINDEIKPLRKGSSNDDSGDEVWKRLSSINVKESEASSNKDDVKILQPSTVPPIFTILRKTWLHCASVIFTFFVTLACFPAITASVKSMLPTSTWTTLYFTPVCCFLLFNVCDWLGRSIAGHVHIPSADNRLALTVCVLMRGAFLALFALCNAYPRKTPVVFSHDAYFIAFMIVFAASNGHLGTLSMQYGPRMVEPQHAATAGSLLGFCVSVGLALGAGFSFVIKMLI